MVMSKHFRFLPTSFPIVFLSSYSCTVTTCRIHLSPSRRYRVAGPGNPEINRVLSPVCPKAKVPCPCPKVYRASKKRLNEW